ncbi:MAG: hypothetical protein KDC98_15835 [Planctomycetes bacterium]|nr:hypothetical protein [Planctomycetota bacterium]
MRNITLAASFAFTVLAVSATAQNNFLGRTKYFSATWAGYVPGGSLAAGGDALDTIAAGELTDFGIDNATAINQQFITGMQFVLQDQNAATSHTFYLVGYPESLTTPDTPDVATPFMNVGPYASPTIAAGGIAAWIFTVAFTTPMQAPRERSAFVGMNLPSATATTDILLNQFIDDDTTNLNGPGNTPIYSQPGQSYAVNYPGGGLPSSHRLGVSATVITFGTRPASIYVDLQVKGPGGHALTFSNETENPAVVGAASAVTTPHTAFYPDAVDHNAATPARADGAGYLYTDNAFVTGDIVALLAAFNLNPLNVGTPLPLSSFLGGSTGNACLDLAVNVPIALLFAPTSTGTGTPPAQYFETTFAMPAWAATQGFQVVFQGLTLASASGVVRGGPCSVQTF